LHLRFCGAGDLATLPPNGDWSWGSSGRTSPSSLSQRPDGATSNGNVTGPPASSNVTDATLAVTWARSNVVLDRQIDARTIHQHQMYRCHAVGRNSNEVDVVVRRLLRQKRPTGFGVRDRQALRCRTRCLGSLLDDADAVLWARRHRGRRWRPPGTSEPPVPKSSTTAAPPPYPPVIGSISSREETAAPESESPPPRRRSRPAA
jgi:hypothetical protein